MNSGFLGFGNPGVAFLLIRVSTSSTKYLSSLNSALIFCCNVDHTHTVIRSLYFSIGIRAGTLVFGLIS
jgi:hypothetical protein